MKKDISKEIVAKIKKEKIKPTEKWKVDLKNYAYWGVVGLFVFLSGAFFSLIIFNLAGFGGEMFGFFGLGKFLKILIFAAPYLWIVAFAVCVVLGVLIFQKTKTGYRHNVLFVVSIILLFVSVIGVLGHVYRMNEKFEDRLLHNPKHPIMSKLKRDGRMLMPEEGILIGEIVKLEDDKLHLKDPRDEKWKVFYSDKTKIGKKVELEQGKRIFIAGEKKGEHGFSAFRIWEVDRMKGGMHPPLGGKAQRDLIEGHKGPMIEREK